MTLAYAAVVGREGRVREIEDSDEAFRVWGEQDGGCLTMVLDHPDEQEIYEAARVLNLHELAVEDTMEGHQRPKLERYGETLFLVLHPVAYRDRAEKLEVTETHLFVGPDHFLAITRGKRDRHRAVHQVRRALRRSGEEAANPQCFLYELLDAVVDEYEPILVELDEDLDEIEENLFAGDEKSSQRIYELFNEVVKFQRATRPLNYMMELLMRGTQKYGTPETLLPRFRDVKDHAIRASDHLDGLRAALQNALTVEATLVAQDQNDAMKKMSAWAAILIAPTIIAGIYGMNFQHMPELDLSWGYYGALGLMVAVCTVLWGVFKKKDWL